MTEIASVIISCAPNVHLLSPGSLFKSLSVSEKSYAYYSAQAAWSGTRIILRQVSPESPHIFDYILELQRVCVDEYKDDWTKMAKRYNVLVSDMETFLYYAAVFLGNIGNYFGQGDQKFVPGVTAEFLRQISTCSSLASKLLNEIEAPMLAQKPCSLGPPSTITQSTYYPNCIEISEEEVEGISRVMDTYKILPENTRIEKSFEGDELLYNILQASVEESSQSLPSEFPKPIHIIRGDHSAELRSIRQLLEKAQHYAANDLQKEINILQQESFTSGDLNTYRECQKQWVKDKNPSVETVFGFVEPYRDPFGIRAEFEGIVGLSNKDETEPLMELVQQADKFVRRLPWADHFEKDSFGSPGFLSLNVLAYCSSMVFPGVNLPNYNDIRQSDGYKGLMFNNTTVKNDTKHVEASELSIYSEHYNATYYLWVVFHELFGHGTGKFLEENPLGTFNFDTTAPPKNPLTNKPIESWYGPNQTWTGVFGAIATSVDECRAECVGAYLMSDMELLALFGYNQESKIIGQDLEYNMYLQLGVSGLRALENYNPETTKWGNAHSRAHFAIFQCLLASEKFMVVKHDPDKNELFVSIDRIKISTHGRPALEDLLQRLHIYRCTADFQSCEEFFESLTKPGSKFLNWRKTVIAHPLPRNIYVQANTLEEGDKVILREYDSSVKGVILSWFERMNELNRSTKISVP